MGGSLNARALVRQAKLDASVRVKVLERKDLADHLYRVLHVSRSSFIERTEYMKRTQGIMQAVGKSALPETNLASKIAKRVGGNEINASEACTCIVVKQDYMRSTVVRRYGMYKEKHQRT